MTEDRLAIGGNSPPPHEAMALHVDDLFQLVSDTTEGVEVKTDEQEAKLDDLLGEIKQAAKDAEAKRKAEKEPHLEAGRQVDANWKPIKDRLDAAAAEIKRLLTPYRVAKQAAKDEAARKAREEAEAKERAAQAKLREPEHLQARFDAEEELKAARKLKAVANRTEREATGLRTHWEAELTDRKAALIHLIGLYPARFEALVQQMANEEARGARAPIPGVIYHERKQAA